MEVVCLDPTKKVRVPATIVNPDNSQFEKSISGFCDQYEVIEKHINISMIVVGVDPRTQQAQLQAVHCCYMVALMTEQEQKDFIARQTLLLQK